MWQRHCIMCCHYCALLSGNSMVTSPITQGYLSCMFALSMPGTKQTQRMCKVCRKSSKTQIESMTYHQSIEHDIAVTISIMSCLLTFLSQHNYSGYSGDFLHILHMHSVSSEGVRWCHSTAAENTLARLKSPSLFSTVDSHCSVTQSPTFT